MTRLITIGLVIIGLWIGWIIYQQWEKTSSTQDLTQSQVEEARRAAAATFDPRSLPGLPDKLEDSLQTAKDHGAKTLGAWLDFYATKEKVVEDPRLAWIQLDYAVLLAPDDPAQAKQIYGDVRDRIPPTSPIYPRIKELEKTFE
jgi:hypothetical protein